LECGRKRIALRAHYAQKKYAAVEKGRRDRDPFDVGRKESQGKEKVCGSNLKKKGTVRDVLKNGRRRAMGKGFEGKGKGERKNVTIQNLRKKAPLFTTRATMGVWGE